MDAVGHARNGAVAAADGEEIEKHEPVAEDDDDMESDPAAAREKEQEQVQPWREQVTLRGMVAAMLIGFMYTVIVMKIALTTGLVPTLNVSAALMAFLALRGWTRVLERLGVAHRPFTRQENCVIETCAVACYTIAFGGQLLSSQLSPAGIDAVVSWRREWRLPLTDSRARVYVQVGSAPRCWAWTRRRTSSPGPPRPTCRGATRTLASAGWPDSSPRSASPAS